MTVAGVEAEVLELQEEPQHAYEEVEVLLDVEPLTGVLLLEAEVVLVHEDPQHALEVAEEGLLVGEGEELDVHELKYKEAEELVACVEELEVHVHEDE